MNPVLPVVAGLLVWLAAMPGGANKTAAETHSPPRTIDATGTEDVTDELEGFIEDVPDGGVISLPSKARYRIERTLTVRERHDLTIDGNGTTLFAATEGDRNRSHVRIDGGSDLTLRDLIVDGANPEAGLGDDAYREDREAQHGFDLAGAVRVELDSVAVTDVYGDSVYIGQNVDGVWSSQVWIHVSLFTRTGRQGTSVTAGRDVVIERNVYSQTRRATIDLEPNLPTQGASNVHVLDNRVGRGRLLFVAAHGNGPVDHIVIADNELRGRSLTISVTPPGTERRSSFYVVGNVSDTRADRTPMTFVRIDGVVVRNNDQPLVSQRAKEGEVGVQVTSVCSLDVRANDFGTGTVACQRGSPCGDAPDPQAPAPPAIPARDQPAPARPPPRRRPPGPQPPRRKRRTIAPQTTTATTRTKPTASTGCSSFPSSSGGPPSVR
ncbi:MAG: hypothetical protein WKF43_00140 [Acidimicrobiales bacterium]